MVSVSGNPPNSVEATSPPAAPGTASPPIIPDTASTPGTPEATSPPDSPEATNPSGRATIPNPIGAALSAGMKDNETPSARTVVGVLPWSALAATMIVSLRVLMVAHLNLPVALQLVSLTNTPKVLLGLAVTFFEPLLIVVALYVHLACSEILHDAIKAARSNTQFLPSNRGIFFIFMWPLVAVMSFAFFANKDGLLVLVGAALWTTQRAWLDSKPSNPGSSSSERPKPSLGFRLTLIITGMLMLGIGFAGVALDDQPWLPPEQIALTNGKMTVGYVVAESSSDLTILRDRDRSIVTIPTNHVERQTLCRIGATYGDWFVRLAWGGGPKLPSCTP